MTVAVESRLLQSEGSAVVAAKDADRAEELISGIYTPITLLRRDTGPLDMELRFLHSAKLTIGRLRFGADTELVVPAPESAYHLNFTLSGSSTFTQSGKRGVTTPSGHGALFNPHDDFKVRWSADAQQYSLKLPLLALSEHVGALLNRHSVEYIEFAHTYDANSPEARNLRSAIDFLRRETERPDGIGSSPLARSQLESYVMTQVLLTVPNSYRAELLRPAKPAQRGRIADVVSYIETHPEEDLTVPQMARIAGVTARALSKGISDATGMPPSAYVRKVRLERARAEIQYHAGRKSISDIASSWGFTHLSRFSHYYRRQFGELPSETVRANLR